MSKKVDNYALMRFELNSNYQSWRVGTYFYFALYTSQLCKMSWKLTTEISTSQDYKNHSSHSFFNNLIIICVIPELQYSQILSSTVNIFTIKTWAMKEKKRKNNAIENQIHWNLNDYIIIFATEIYKSHICVYMLCINAISLLKVY